MIFNKKFTKNVENFTCENCGFDVKGNGYTNHCPECLWSKHVDVGPGDRQNECKGMMKPREVLVSRGDYSIVHRCVRCGAEKKNKVAPGDNFEKIVEIISAAR